MRIVVVGNPENRRVTYFCNALRALDLPAPEIITYHDILDGRRSLSDALTSETLLRIESPGENFEVEKKLIARGAGVSHTSEAERISTVRALQLEPDPGRIRFLKQWFLGFRNVLQQWQKDVDDSRSLVFNTPEAISLMFDKPACQQHLHKANISVPRLLPGAGGYDELREIARHSFRSVFIKASHSSSASGVIGYRVQGNREEVITSMELVREYDGVKLYNALKMKRYTANHDIRVLVDYILREGAVVEEWIPKASMQGRFFDVRIVVMNGSARFVLPRLSAGPITNLHLGNRRGDAEEMKTYLGKKRFDEMIQCAEQAVGCVTGAFYAGVDVLIPAGDGPPRVLELNAFGDLLPGLEFKGDDTYLTGLKEFLHAA